MLSLRGYQIISELHRSSRTVIYRGQQRQPLRPVVLKTLADAPSPESIARLHHEYAILKSLDIEGVIKAYGLETQHRIPVLILEDIDGVSLKQYLLEQPLTLKQFLDIAVQLAEVLGKLHQHHIIHRDIKPSNIIFNPAKQRIKLADFATAICQGSDETCSSPSLMDPMEGTLAYMSPEQTGRMNRAVDYRTDFYSLGVTLYEMLCRRLPFDATDPMELVHCQLARQPVPPHQINPEVPESIANVVMKLLAKMADDRYQSAWGIEADLVLCLMQYEATGTIEPFTPGENDVSDRFQIPQKLYGRQHQLQELLTLAQSVLTPTHPATLDEAVAKPTLVLVSGYTGCGKSSLVRELHVPALHHQAYFCCGEFTADHQTVPYSGVIMALRSLLNQVLGDSDRRLYHWRTQLLTALQQASSDLIEHLPELAMVLGSQMPCSFAAITPGEDIGFGIQQIIQVFCQPDHPLVLFLDNLQWADVQSLELIEQLVSRSPLQHLLLLGAYRSNEIDRDHPLLTMLINVHGAGNIYHIPLEPLLLEDITDLLADTLRQSHTAVQPLATVVMQKTAGSPLFIHEFLQEIHRQHFIHFDFERLNWTWDLKSIAALNTTDNLVDLAINKLTKLPASTQQILQSAACLGTQFDVMLLAEIQQRSLSDVTQDLHPAVQDGLVLPVSESEGSGQPAGSTHLSTSQYRFLHQRVQQAAYGLIPMGDRAILHQQVGRILLAATPASAFHDNSFEILNHLNLGAELLTETSDRMELVHLNLLTGRKASSAGQYALATRYFNTALKLLPTNGWQIDYDITLEVHNEAAIANFLAMNLQMAIDLTGVVFHRATTLLDQVTACEISLRCFVARSQFREALDLALALLDQFGVLTDSPLPNLSPPEMQAVLKILRWVLPVAQAVDPSVYTHMHDMVTTWSAELASISSTHDLEQPLLLPSIQRNQPIAALCTELKAAIQRELNSGHPEFAARYAVDYCYYLIWSGESLETIANDYEQQRTLLRTLKQSFYESWLAPWQQVIHNLVHSTDRPQYLKGSYFNPTIALPEFEAQGNLTLLCLTYLAQTYLAYVLGDYPEALACIALVRDYRAGLPSDYMSTYQILDGLVTLAHGVQASPDEQARIIAYGLELQTIGQQWLSDDPDYFQGWLDLLHAELAGIQADILTAMEYYDRALHAAHVAKLPQQEAIAAERAAAFYQRLGRQSIVLTYLRRAYDSYYRWGATTKVHQLEAIYPQLLTLSGPLPDSYSLVTISNTSGTRLLDFSTVLKASQVLTSEIILDRLLEKMMQIAIENVGAEWGALLLEQDGRWTIAASGDSDYVTVLPTRSELDTSPPSPMLPQAILNYVLRTRTHVVLEDASHSEQFTNDIYIQTYRPKSLLCTPLIHQGKLSGILYLENNLTIGAFTPDRLEVLQMLSSQLAISIDNAQLYANLHQFNQNLENLVKERTQELSLTLSNLQAAQSQLVEAEKMAALGGLVAGVAHEINTPIGIGVTAASLLADRTAKFVETYRSGKMKRSDLEAFLDLASQSSAMILANLNRAADLIHSFKQVAVDQSSEERRQFNLRTYLDEILLSLRPKLKPTKHQVTIACPDDLMLDSYPGAFSQIITNLVINSLVHAYGPGEQGNIAISVQTSHEQLTLSYSDDGCGISPDHLHKIFDPFFTTRRGQGGSGLGLHIVYNLVTQKLGGTIHCQSQLGEGTTFVITVPLSLGNKAESPVDSSPSQGTAAGE
ncbi:MAG: AAA family ATPase [Cyanobacteriota bacterium SKYGB_h_bin112]|nr:AAA family ATPase [Cyanobacteriota bacterium SKYGB_h_bin112]